MLVVLAFLILSYRETIKAYPTAGGAYMVTRAGFELPEQGCEIPVSGRGRLLGRFVLEPRPGVGVSLEQRVVAVALADQVGATLAVPAAS
jgi:hypothetical protein